MAIIMKADIHKRITISGDVTASLKIPLMGVEDRFWIALSDGSRILATPDMTGAYAFQLVDEGAAIVHIDGNRIDVEWRVDWVVLSAFYDAVRRPPNEMSPLPLFDRLAA